MTAEDLSNYRRGWVDAMVQIAQAMSDALTAHRDVVLDDDARHAMGTARDHATMLTRWLGDLSEKFEAGAA